MSAEQAELLSNIIQQLPFAEPVMNDHSEDGTKVQVICRIHKGAEQAWATVVEKILRRAESSGFSAHVCRLYFMRGDVMVYGWHVGLTSTTSVEYAVSEIMEAILGRKKKKAPVRKPLANLASMGAYSPPLDADAQGNPVVGRQLESMPFSGMEHKTDRNSPTPKNEDGRGGGLGVMKIR